MRAPPFHRLPASQRLPGRSARRGGFTLVELFVVMFVMTTAVSMLAGTMISTGRLGPLRRERALASDGARTMLETLRNATFAERFALYNADPADDPGGAGTAPGCHFDIEGLTPLDDDPDGHVGRVRFAADAAPLREDAEDEDLGFPRDLNADGFVDGDDHAGDYIILPVAVEVAWQGASGPMRLTIQAMFADV
jgi:hypothetical protein